MYTEVRMDTVCAHVEPYPLSFLAFHCFQAVLPNTSFPLFPMPRCVSTDTRQAEKRECHGTCRGVHFSCPINPPAGLSRSTLAIPVRQSAEGVVWSSQGREYLTRRPRPLRPDGHVGYRYVLLILLLPSRASQSHTMAHHPGFAILL
jgi:hypothetical protein